MTDQQQLNLDSYPAGGPVAKARPRDPRDHLADIPTLKEFCQLYREWSGKSSVPAGPQCLYLEEHPEQVPVRKYRRSRP